MLLAICYSSITYSQTNLEEKAKKYLNQRGQLSFTITVGSLDQIDELKSIITFDHGQNPNDPYRIKAIATERQFERFLSLGLQYEIDDSLNKPIKVLMSNSKEYRDQNNVSRVVPLTFPLTAYPTYQDYADQMALFATNNPSICQLVNIGATTEGDKDLLFIKLSKNVATNEQEPRLMYTSSMHGDEIAGYPLMLNLIDYFITAYNDTNHSDHTRVKNLLDTSEIWINPSANPDGTYYNDPTNTSVANARRYNDNGWDLNRNYPDNVGGAHPDGNSVYETETQHFIDLANNYHFVLSANFHGGVEVVNYPWDNTYTLHPDDDWYQLISREYADNCQAASSGINNGYMDYLDNGITNGAAWYRVEGGRQDYMNYYHHCRETTIELSNAKTPAAGDLVNLWNFNQEALIDYLVQGTYGFRGVVKDAISSNPIDATITLVGHDAVNSHTKNELPFGDFYRPVKAGTYDILIEADCYQSVTLSSQAILDGQILALGDILLTPVANSAPTNLASSNVGGSTATVAWDAITGASYDYRYREVGAPSWTTTNTSNNSEILSGLTMNTQYEVQVRSTCDTNTSSYSSSMLFTTLNSTTLHQGYFESNTDNWVVGGGDSFHYTGGVFAYENNGALRIRDNSGANSTVTSPTFNLSTYESVDISFYYYPNGMEGGEYFVLEFYNGSSWQNIGTYTSGTDFSNGSFYNVSHNLDGATYNLANNAQFRFRCEASTNSDDIYIDQVIVTGNDTPALNTNNLDFENGLRISPNPFKNELLINVPQNINYSNLEIILLDIRGRKLLSKEYFNDFSNMKLSNLNNLASGAYFVKISDRSNQISTIRKLIKE